ncbi:Ig domain-containing protein [Clostridium thailandense]|uniref:Ig-like domain-containing protein n=1 Tax=Clostridium thailandense TaxID=2794346 RepID=UPI00398A1780
MSKFNNLMSKIVIIFAMALIVGILGHTNVQAATIGQQLTVPESGWQRFDNTDSNILYTGTWDSGTTTSPWYKFTYNQTNTLNSSVKFNFTKDKIRLIAPILSSGSSNIQIKIDNNIVETYSLYKSSRTDQVLVYEKTGLSNTEHCVEITLPYSGYIFFDAIDIDLTGELKPYNETPATNVSNISLNKSTDNLQVGQTDTLTATITPDNATNKTATWTSSDPTIATVDSNGVVTAVKEGTATITATTTDESNLSVSCVVNVTSAPSNTGKAILTITLTNGTEKEYDLSMTEVNSFINWYNGRASGTGNAYYTFNKNASLAAFTKRTEYILYDKIVEFNVDEYTK